MRRTNSERSWWQAFSDFIRALDDMDDHSPYDGLAARVAQLEKRIADLDPASRSDSAATQAGAWSNTGLSCRS